MKIMEWFSLAEGEGLITADIEAERSGEPFFSLRLELPPMRRGCYYAPFQKYAIDPSLDLWPEGYNQCHPLAVEAPRNLKRGGMFFLIELTRGGYLALLPVVTPRLMCWLRADADGLLVEGDHWGTDGIRERAVPVLAWARGSDPYDCVARVWARAADDPEIAQNLVLRRHKKLPLPFQYLGWCTWEEFKWAIDEQSLVETLTALGNSQAPVRWVLIDDGHIDHVTLSAGPMTAAGEAPADGDARKLRSLGVDAEKFPRGWTPVLDAARAAGIRWTGVWLNFNGYWGGIAADNALGSLNGSLLALDAQTLQPKPEAGAAEMFYDALTAAQRAAGFDFIKVDNQAKNVTFYRGRVPNAVQAASRNHAALEGAVQRHLTGMINCMAHNNLCAFHTRFSQVTRCSEDYKKGDLWRAKHHLSNSYFNMLWMRETVWGDHDMFHSDDAVAGGVMARSKALSGGPVYLSDAPENFRIERIHPLCFADGEILRPIEPAVPAPDSLFCNTYESEDAFRVLAPLAGGAAAVAAYNLTSPERPVRGTVAASDHTWARRLAGGLPEEPIVACRWRDTTARVLREPWTFELPGFGDEVFWLSPLRAGWAVFGRADKYIGPAAIVSAEVSEEKLDLSLRETGPVLLWLSEGSPQDTFCPSIQRLGPNLWRLDYPVGEPRKLVITRL